MGCMLCMKDMVKKDAGSSKCEKCEEGLRANKNRTLCGCVMDSNILNVTLEEGCNFFLKGENCKFYCYKGFKSIFASDKKIQNMFGGLLRCDTNFKQTAALCEESCIQPPKAKKFKLLSNCSFGSRNDLCRFKCRLWYTASKNFISRGPKREGVLYCFNHTWGELPACRFGKIILIK